ncbi:MAG: hypothetical protein OQJ78_09220 [Ignavibacteriaceae bacterium]|jgi:hypothetical protein|nr:hypothetical protein [Ignavibacteriaceae bacterium]
MANCELIEKCVFFNDKMGNMPGTAEMFKIKYCKEDNSYCARHMVVKAVGREKVPPNLFPNQTDEAKRLISASQ